MKRFIDCNELARDRRFVRQDNATVTILSKLPDDVNTVVELLDRFTPLIEAASKGTVAEPLLEAYGPAFGLITLNEPLRPDDPVREEGGICSCTLAIMPAGRWLRARQPHRRGRDPESPDSSRRGGRSGGSK